VKRGNAKPSSTTRRTRGTIAAHLIALVVLQVVFVGGLVAFSATQDFRKARSDAETHTASTARLAADFIVTELDSNNPALADMPNVLGAVSVAKLCELAAETPEDTDERWFHATVHLVRRNGSPACAGTDHASLANESWFKAALATSGPVNEGPVVDPITGKLAIIYAIGTPELVVAYSNEAESFGPALDNQFGNGPSPVSFTVIDADRTSEIASSGRRTGRSTRRTGFAKPLGRGANTFAGLDGTDRIHAEATVEGRSWHVYAGTATADAFGDARRALRERLVFAAFIVLAVILAAAVLQRRFVRPIKTLSRVAERFGRGEADLEFTPSGPVELAALGETMNEMVRLREGAEHALQKAFTAEQRASAELREVDGMRNAFLMAISHELRTPLTSVTGYATFLNDALDELSPEEVARCIGSIASQSTRLERLLLDLLDVERLSRGVIEPNRRETDIGELVPRVLDGIGATARATTMVAANASGTVDPALVERIVENLVLNAIKHTPPESRIWVRASRRNGELRITVEDDGPGVPDDVKERIFEAFAQGDVPSHSPGTGIGLTLVAQFAKLHGGRAWVGDRKGGGAAFHVVLPVRPQETKRRSRTRRVRRQSVAA
jgi:signal transduction histidine kinase